MLVVHSVAELIGQTPMMKLSRLTKQGEASIFAKLESFNAGGSVKDRTVKYLIEYAEASGVLTPEKTIIEATSGNTGISTAMLAAAKGYQALILMSESASLERRSLIQAYGAELRLTPGELGTGGAIEEKEKILAETPNKFVDLSQFKSPVNVLAHYQTLGKELLDQLDGNVDAVVVGVGTGGTGVGVSKRVKQYDSSIRVIGVAPCMNVNIPGLRNPCSNNGSRLFDEAWFDEIKYVESSDLEPIIRVARMSAEKTGVLVGFSGAANLYYALKLASELGEKRNIVAIIPDGGERYLSTNLYRMNP